MNHVLLMDAQGTLIPCPTRCAMREQQLACHVMTCGVFGDSSLLLQGVNICADCWHVPCTARGL